MSLGKRLAASRKERGLTQQALSDKTGIHVTQIKRYEGGSIMPSVDALRKLVLALHSSADELIFAEDERGPTDQLKLYFEAVSQLEDDEQRTIMELIDGMLLRHDAKRRLMRVSP